ncbi:LysR family transcriptional regulator [Vibrio sp. SCSIO 43140]|uniref:LysR family transcriptional regulator n=1 Tax=Vibrio sp. SCSIO 43140 TaxID=2819100 RepID=UPI002075D8BE|nr:LysR family transcriptional regulator [Vibrio sp. SCSIO 43140]USD63692.1 LysR family transcriptional regulator [Vibrio sp. SCSIO 43140]
MKIADLKLFKKVVELGSFTAAANAFDLPRANVSRRINELEKVVGAQLFHRTTRSISLTNSGEAYYEEINKAIELLDRAQQSVSSAKDMLKGKIKLGVLPETYDLLQPILFEFHDKYPQIELDIRSISNGFNEIFQQGLDIAIHGGAIFDSDIVARKVIQYHRALVASPDYLDQFVEPKSLSDLHNHKCICFRWPSGDVDVHWHFESGTVSVKPNLIANSIGFIKGATLRGRGISFLPTMMIQNELKDGSLVPLLSQETAKTEDGWILYPQPKTLNKASKALIEHLSSEIPRLNQLS